MSQFTCKWGTITEVRSSVIAASGKKQRCVRIVVEHTFDVRRNNFRRAIAACGHTRHEKGMTVITVRLQKGQSSDRVVSETMALFESNIRQCVDKARTERVRRYDRRRNRRSEPRPVIVYSLNTRRV